MNTLISLIITNIKKYPLIFVVVIFMQSIWWPGISHGMEIDEKSRMIDSRTMLFDRNAEKYFLFKEINCREGKQFLPVDIINFIGGFLIELPFKLYTLTDESLDFSCLIDNNYDSKVIVA